MDFRADAMIKEINYTLLYSYEMENGFSWTAEPGDDIKAMDGSYEFNELEDGSTEVLYALRVDPAFTCPDSCVVRPRSRSCRARCAAEEASRRQLDAHPARHRQGWRRQDNVAAATAVEPPRWATAPSSRQPIRRTAWPTPFR